MKKYLIICMFCFTATCLYSCASSKKNTDGNTAAAQKREQKEAEKKKQEQRGPVQEQVKKAPEPDNKNRTLEIPLENK